MPPKRAELVASSHRSIDRNRIGNVRNLFYLGTVANPPHEHNTAQRLGTKERHQMDIPVEVPDL